MLRWSHFFVLRFCLLVTGVTACTPTYPQCICRTENLSCDTIEAIRLKLAKHVWGLRVPGNTTEELTASMEALKADPAHKSLDAANFVGGVARLVWHDAAEYDPESADSLRSDGCVNLADNGNAGLDSVIQELDTFWLPFCNKISRADFWVLAAKTVIEESTSYVASQFGRNVNAVDGGSHGEKKSKSGSRRLIKGDAVLDSFVLPFRYGRQDVSTCAVSGKARLPSAEKGAMEIQTYIMRKFNLNARHAVALLGAHTLGRCDVNNSGYNSTWKDRGDLFTTAYFKLLLVGRWKREQMTNPRSGRALFQWNHQSNSDREQWAMMLATDMQLVYAIEPENRSNQAFAIECGPLDKESQKSSDLRCPTTGSVYPSLPFETYVQEFAEGDTETHDEPGASKWLVAFAEAFRKMTEIGYNSEVDLQCPQCPPEICSSCPREVLCGSGAVYFKNSSTAVAPINGSSGGFTYVTAGVPSTSSSSTTGSAGSPGTSTTQAQGSAASSNSQENDSIKVLMAGLFLALCSLA